jgi:ABC-type nitrate/sulfonate/bicarbonate transport system, permease component
MRPAHAPRRRLHALFERLAPVPFGLAVIGAWELLVRLLAIPAYLLPGPLLVGETLWRDGASLLAALLVTLQVTAAALALATVLGIALAVLIVRFHWFGRSVYPYLVTLQVTPVVAIAPLILIWIDDVFLAQAICAAIVAFFPIVANTSLGLESADRDLIDLFRLNRATPWQTLRLLRLPTALPYILAGVRISGGLALIGAVVAEFVAGTGGASTGLATRILEAGYRLEVPRMFAALVLLAVTGVLIHAGLGAASRLLLARRDGRRDGDGAG